MKKVSLLVALAALVAVPAMAANTLAVTGAAALEGNYGLAVTHDGSTNDVYVSSTHPNAEPTYNFSFIIYPGTLASPLTVADYSIGFVKSTTGTKKWFIPIYLRRQNAFWTIQTNVRQDNNSFAPWQTAVKVCGDASTTIPCTDPFYTDGVEFEFRYTAASAPGANDGTLEVYKDGTLRKTFSGLDTDQRLVDEIRWGAIFQGDTNNHPPGNGGTYYFDSFVSTR